MKMNATGKLVPKDDAVARATCITDNKGEADLGTLIVGTYYLVETKAPAGYFLIDHAIKLTVSKVETTDTTDADGNTTTVTTGGVVLEDTEEYANCAVDPDDPHSYLITALDTPKYGHLLIVKYLDKFELSEDATFVFDVIGKIDGKTVYSNTAVLTCSQANPSGVLSTVLTFIPAGAEVTVTEVYSGSHYTLVSDASQTTTIRANVTPTLDPKINAVVFENTYVPEEKGGHGVVNIFAREYDETNGWHWGKVTPVDSTPDDVPALPPPPYYYNENADASDDNNSGGDGGEGGAGSEGGNGNTTEGNPSGETSGGPSGE